MSTTTTTTATPTLALAMTSTECATCTANVTLPRNVTSCRCCLVVYCDNSCKKQDYRGHSQICSFTRDKILSIETYNRTLASTGDEPLAREMVLGPLISILQYKNYITDIKEAQLAPDKRDFFRTVEKIRRKDALCKGDRTYPQLQRLDAQVFSYTGAAADKEHHERYFSILLLSETLEKEMESGRLKQQLFDGDRTHPRVVCLDAFAAHNDYPGIRNAVDSALRRHISHPSLFDAAMAAMVKSAQVHALNSASPGTKQNYEATHPMEAKFMKVTQTLTYPDASQDIRAGSQLVEHKAIEKQIQMMSRREMVFGKGSTSNRDVLQIKGLELHYPDSEKDIHSMLRSWTNDFNIQDKIDTALRKEAHHNGTLSNVCPEFKKLSRFYTHCFYPEIVKDYEKCLRRCIAAPSLFEKDFAAMHRKYAMYNRMKPLVALCLCLKHGEGHYVYRQDVLRAHIFSYLHLYGERFLYHHSEAKTSGRMSLGKGK